MMKTYVDVIGSFVKDWIWCQLFSTLVINVECHRFFCWISRFVQQVLEKYGAMYSALVPLIVTHDCFFDSHDTGQLSTKYTNPVYDLRTRASPPNLHQRILRLVLNELRTFFWSSPFHEDIWRFALLPVCVLVFSLIRLFATSFKANDLIVGF